MNRDDRLERMMRDPEAYFAECEERARQMIERDIAREIERDRQQRKAARVDFWRRWLWWRS